MQNRKASIKETGEELSPAEWERFDAAVEEIKAERKRRLDEGSNQDGTRAERHSAQAVG